MVFIKSLYNKIYHPSVFIIADTIIVLLFAVCIKIVISVIDKMYSANPYIEIVETLSHAGLTIGFAIFVIHDLYMYFNELKKPRKLLYMLEEIEAVAKDYE